ncbi:multidrug resistance protein NorM [Clostridium homopropionicum DSM 5847]|uniref:Probable multidrug resistance protein NorM n=1 Tax=Clostridium homopropionicum DSM 5847 TaxID=1121318 RepID=A0A0L6Z7K4_9CLOT|nr:MATE family efflux transporter [Clostridium homopropionicum]KOA18951.1 multidrug resistance protein NorM [Clostridium homopropionicum DSM 5847]SFG43596.1 putative efflux protein, MATE family [Clostridium homopropionicum]
MLYNVKVIKNVLKLALPAVGEMILYMTIWVFDTMMVGKYGGQTAVSSVGLSSEILYTFVNMLISVGISVGITSLVARRYGAKELSSAEEYATIGFFIGVIIALILSISMFTFSRQILIFGGAKLDVIGLGVMYMRIVSLGLFFNMLTSMMNAVLRGYGNTKTPLIISFIINIINIALDWVLIFGRLGFPELGIKGAAIATATAHICGFIFAITYMKSKSKIKIKPKYIIYLNKRKLTNILTLSIPSSLQEGAFSISRLISTFMIMHIGQTAFAANQITTTIESISFMPGWGFGIAATTLVGHKIGEKNIREAKVYSYTCAALGTVFMGICAITFLIAPNFLISLFIKETEKEVIRLGAFCLMVASVEQIPMAISLILNGSLKGAGDTKTPFIISLISSWGIRLPLMFLFIYILKVSVIYVWWITSIQWIFEGILMIILFNKKFKSFEKS